MTEFDKSGKNLLWLSIGDLVSRYKDLPLDDERPNWESVDFETEESLHNLGLWVDDRLEELKEGNGWAVYVEEDFLLEINGIMDAARQGHERLEHESLFVRGRIWHGEAFFWLTMMISDPDESDKYVVHYTEALGMAIKLFMVSEIITGHRFEGINDVVIFGLDQLGYEYELRELKESSVPVVKRGEHGRRNAAWN